jgi:hypothetical protein
VVSVQPLEAVPRVFVVVCVLGEVSAHDSAWFVWVQSEVFPPASWWEVIPDVCPQTRQELHALGLAHAAFRARDEQVIMGESWSE